MKSVPGRSRRETNVTPEKAPQSPEESLDQTIADSFPASDPPSTDPAPKTDSEAA